LRSVAGLEALTSLKWSGEAPPTLEAALEREEVREALPPDLGPDQIRERFTLFQANRGALAAYRPRPYGGRIVLVRAEATAAGGGAEGFEGWRELAGRGSETHILPGDHYSLLKPPVVSRLAELLEETISRAQPPD
ncbi:MAG TPA: hypothetical protein VLE27_00935, partial [Thermoanaerobaculia bacterium]|nr:hypothetical protein [Thermoanaerobaculia bacterium]